jgi:PAS domain S-box-containing protein
MSFDYEKFSSLRKIARHSVVEFCRMAGISRTTLWQWETGKRVPPDEMIYHLASLLKVDVNIISNLEPIHVKSTKDYGPLVSSFRKIAVMDKDDQSHYIGRISREIAELEKNLEYTNIVVNALINSFEVVFYVKNSAQNYIMVNKAFKKNISLHHTFKALGKTDSDFFNAGEAKINTEQDREVIRSAKPLSNFEQFLPGSRRKKIVLTSKIPIFDKSGGILGVIGYFVDITERRKNEQILHMIQHNIDLMKDSLTISEGKNFVYLNETAKNAFQNNKQIKMDRDFWLNNIVHPEDREREEEYIKNKKWPVYDKYRAIMPDGKNIWVGVTRSSIKYFNKEYILALGRNMTDIVEINNKNKNLIETINKSEDAFILIECKDDKENFFFSEGIEKVTGYEQKKFIDKELIFRELVHPDDKQKVLPVKDLINKIKKYGVEDNRVRFRLLHKSGKIIWVESRIFYNYSGNVLLIGTILRDISIFVNNENSAVENVKNSIADKLRKEGVSEELIKKVIFDF